MLKFIIEYTTIYIRVKNNAKMWGSPNKTNFSRKKKNNRLCYVNRVVE